MRIIPAVSKRLLSVLSAGLVLAACTTQPAPDMRSGYAGRPSPALLEHRRKQQLRAERGNYRRLYRSQDCRYGARDCGGYSTFTPN